jgi:hypothetical protein
VYVVKLELTEKVCEGMGPCTNDLLLLNVNPNPDGRRCIIGTSKNLQITKFHAVSGKKNNRKWSFEFFSWTRSHRAYKLKIPI